jgi:SAM-dependent methyltransferase
MVQIKQPGSRAEYVFGAGEAEIARLLERTVSRRPPAEALFDRIGVAPGWHVLDAGCGPLGVLDLLAERVSGSGTVVGVDREPTMIEAARRVLDSRGLQRVRVVTADIAQMPLASESFDLVHERLALVNLVEAPAAVTEMVRLARPGGWVALQEYDHVSLLCQPPHPAWDLLMAAWDRVRTAAAMDNTVGRHLHGLLRMSCPCVPDSQAILAGCRVRLGRQDPGPLCADDRPRTSTRQSAARWPIAPARSLVALGPRLRIRRRQ